MNVEVDGEGFTNVLVYMADALRYDWAAEMLSPRHDIVKTAASGLFTPPCTTTILSGLYPPQHGVYKFSNPLSEQHATIFDLVDGSRHTYALEKTFMSEVSGVEDTEDPEEWQQSLATLEEPFVCFKRDLYTHAPFNQEWEGRGEFDSMDEYFRARLPDTDRILEDYEESVRTVEDRFLADVEVLREQGLLEDTLVIFTSDHGELLGEYGLFGHGWGEAPELVYVPTIFYNDRVTATGDFMAHVDLLPTIHSLLGEPVQLDTTAMGEDLTEGVSEDRGVFNIHASGDEWGMWDEDGGHVFDDHSLLYPLKKLGIDMRTPWVRAYSWKHPVKVFNFFRNRNVTYGDPALSRRESQRIAEEILSNENERLHAKVDEAAKERLNALGYRDEEIE